MKTHLLVAALLLAPLPTEAQDEVPPGLADVERARSRACVPAMAHLASLNRSLEPLSMRGNRLRALDQAIALEDSADVAPFDTADAVEAAIRQWFEEDGALARQWVETGDSAILSSRGVAREAVRQRIRDAVEAIGREGQALIEAAGDVEGPARPCIGAILVRGPVMEVCDTLDSPVCDAARDTAASQFRFVDAPEDIWDVEELRPWTSPGPLQFLPDGSLGGSRTTARARLGNIQVAVAVSPMIRERSGLPEAQVTEFDANLDSLGFEFDHPRFVMAPALELQLAVAGPIGGETHYMLHFGDLSDPPNQVVWSGPATGAPIQAAFPAGAGALARLQQGQTLSVTAVAMDEDTGQGADGEAVYSIALTAVNQGQAIGAVLGYMAGGQLGRDLLRMVPPDVGGG